MEKKCRGERCRREYLTQMNQLSKQAKLQNPPNPVWH